MSKVFYDFLKAQKETFQIMCFDPKLRWDQNLSIFGFGRWVMMVWLNWQTVLSLNMNFDERSLSKLGSTEFELWQLKESPEPLMYYSLIKQGRGVVDHLSTVIT